MSDIQKTNNGGLLGKAMDTMKDPNSTPAAKAGSLVSTKKRTVW